MALINLELYSECLTRFAQVQVIVPEANEKRRLPNGKFPVLWMLHGATDDHTVWERYTSIERYANKAGIAVVMPAVDLSFYANTDGGRYFDYVTEELPAILQRALPLSPLREDNFVAGMSMGGHGTMKLGFSKPELYAAMGIFSCGNFIDLGLHMIPGGQRVPLNFVRWQVFGSPDGDLDMAHGTEHDNRHLAKLASASDKPLPRIFACCGTGDGCHDNAISDIEYFKSLPRPFDCVFFDSAGFHDFEFWDHWLGVFIQWLPIRDRKRLS